MRSSRSGFQCQQNVCCDFNGLLGTGCKNKALDVEAKDAWTLFKLMDVSGAIWMLWELQIISSKKTSWSKKTPSRHEIASQTWQWMIEQNVSTSFVTCVLASPLNHLNHQPDNRVIAKKLTNICRQWWLRCQWIRWWLHAIKGTCAIYRCVVAVARTTALAKKDQRHLGIFENFSGAWLGFWRKLCTYRIERTCCLHVCRPVSCFTLMTYF